MLKKLPIGVSDFKKLLKENCYYVDKSLFIKEILDDGSEVVLIPRPRRFGKTLNLSMLNYFFNINESENLFENLNIWNQIDYRTYRGKHPVIFLTFKDAKNDNYNDCIYKIKEAIRDELIKFEYLLTSPKISDVDRNYLQKLLADTAMDVEYESALKILSRAIMSYHGEKVVILIDEYDVPIQSGYMNQFYDKIIGFIRNFLSAGLKDNIAIQKSVVTGILRVARESVFSGLNNLFVATILDKPYSDKFGLLEHEVADFLQYFGYASAMDIVREWYNGYIFGDTTVYNPWSILNFVNSKKDIPEPFWINTSSNDIIRNLLTKSSASLKQELEILMTGGTIVKVINSNIVMKDIDSSSDSVWNFMLFSGYLTTAENIRIPGDVKQYYRLKIPNLEVQYLFESVISTWVNETLRNDDFNIMLKSLLSGDFETFEEKFQDYTYGAFSYFDTAGDSEKIYHAFVLGMLISLPKDKYILRSNRESGVGRYDVMIIPKDRSLYAIIIEFKKVNKRRKETFDKAIESAFNQMKDKNYRQELVASGFEKIYEVAIAIDGKESVIHGRISR